MRATSAAEAQRNSGLESEACEIVSALCPRFEMSGHVINNGGGFNLYRSPVSACFLAAPAVTACAVSRAKGRGSSALGENWAFIVPSAPGPDRKGRAGDAVETESRSDPLSSYDDAAVVRFRFPSER